MIPVMRSRDVRWSWRQAGHWTGVMMLTTLTTAVLVWVGASASTASMVFLVVVVWTAAQTGVALSLAVALVCALAFDYFFLPPYHTLMLAGAREWISMVSFVACSVATGRLAERAGRQARHAEQRRVDMERLYTLSQELMLHEDGAGLLTDLPRLIRQTFALDAVVLYTHSSEQFHASPTAFPDALQASMREAAAEQRAPFAAGHGFRVQSLMLGLQPMGALCWSPDKLPVEAATAVGAQCAIALTRTLAVEATARLEAQREGDRLRTALIDSLSHELRTPLTTIRAAVTTLRQGDGMDEAIQRDLIEAVDEESARLDALIGDAIEMAEIQAQAVKIRPALLRTRTFLEQVVDESRGMLSRHEVAIEVDGPDDPAWFDPRLIGRVFRHLLENAARYTPAGTRITLRSSRREGGIEFEVEDNGPGIDARELPRIFEKFYRGRLGTKIGKGTGMGLAIAHAIVKAHGGVIEAWSETGIGTRFSLWIPMGKPE